MCVPPRSLFNPTFLSHIGLSIIPSTTVPLSIGSRAPPISLLMCFSFLLPSCYWPSVGLEIRTIHPRSRCPVHRLIHQVFHGRLIVLLFQLVNHRFAADAMLLRQIQIVVAIARTGCSRP